MKCWRWNSESDRLLSSEVITALCLTLTFSLAQIMKPASLIRDRLDEQIRQLQVLRDDVIYHEPGIQKMCESAQQFIQTSSNVTETKKIETKVKEVGRKFTTLIKTVKQRDMFSNEISTTVEVFTTQVESQRQESNTLM